LNWEPPEKVIGNVEAKAIVIEKGGVLQGFCRMLTKAKNKKSVFTGDILGHSDRK
jgi:cytoskeletal protein CcmA (bactofilin family)